MSWKEEQDDSPSSKPDMTCNLTMDKELEAALKAGPRACFVNAALHAGLIQPDKSLDQAQMDFATEIVTLCARIADRYPDPKRTGDTIGDVIREHLFEL
jgi:hypothetical protein